MVIISMKNILYFIPSLDSSGGMERVLLEKVNYLTLTNNYNIIIVTTDMSEMSRSFFYCHPSIKIINLQLFYNKYFDLPFLKKYVAIQKLNKVYKQNVYKIVNEENIDICVTMGGKELEFIGKLGLDAKIIYECHFNKNFRSSFISAYVGNNLFWKIMGFLRDWQHSIQAKSMDKIVVLTQQSYNEWIKITKKVEIIPNPSPIKYDENKWPDPHSKRVIAIGKLSAQKGFDMLIESWVEVKHQCPGWTLDIFGKGELHALLQSKIEFYDLQDVVSLKGITRDVESELLSSAIYVLSSRFEGLPMVLIESLTCGLPVVAFDCETGPREIIVNNDCGILVEQNNIKKLSYSIIELIKNMDLRLIKSKFSKEKAKIYTIDSIMLKWDDLFDKLEL